MLCTSRRPCEDIVLYVVRGMEMVRVSLKHWCMQSMLRVLTFFILRIPFTGVKKENGTAMDSILCFHFESALNTTKIFFFRFAAGDFHEKYLMLLVWYESKEKWQEGAYVVFTYFEKYIESKNIYSQTMIRLPFAPTHI